MTNYSVILNDVTHWVHFIDFENSQFIVLKSNPQILNDLISEHTLPDITAPSIENQRLYWRVLPPLFGKKIPQIPINTLSLVNIGIIKKPRLAIPQVRIPNNLCLPKNCINNLNRCSGIYFSYLQNLTNLSFNRVLSSPDSPPSNDFLLFLLNQSRSKDVPCIQFEESTGEHRFFDILSLQNISSKNFTTLLNCLQSISGPPEIKDVQITKKMILQESIRKFLAAHEYIAPGGGLSPWGRAVLVANSENDDPTILFIELIRAEIIDVNLSSQSNGSVGITDIIERTFSLFQIKTEIPEELEKNSKLGNFEITSGLIYSSIRALLHMIVCGTYLYYTKEPSVSELMDIINDAPFKSFKPLKTGTLMRFLLESSEETVCEFLDKWEIPRKQLKKDVLSAVKWWGNINRATEELKQRSLRPNSRVSNLKNFLVLFECANQFVEKDLQKS